MRRRRVAHDRAGENEAGAAAERLKQAGDDKLVDTLRKHRGNTRDREHDKAADQRWPPAETIRNRA